MLPTLGDRVLLERGLIAISFAGRVALSLSTRLFRLFEDLFKDRFVNARFVRNTLKAGRLPTITAAGYTSQRRCSEYVARGDAAEECTHILKP